MTKTIALTLAIGICSAFSQEVPVLPEKAAALKTSYQAAVARATAPLTKTYLTELERMKVDFTKKGDLQSALAIEAEIKSLGSSNASSQPPEDLSTAERKKKLREFMMAQPWSYGPQTLIFNKDDTASCTDGEKWTYKIKGPTTILLQNKEVQVDVSSDTIPLPGFGPGGSDRQLKKKN